MSPCAVDSTPRSEGVTIVARASGKSPIASSSAATSRDLVRSSSIPRQTHTP